MAKRYLCVLPHRTDISGDRSRKTDFEKTIK